MTHHTRAFSQISLCELVGQLGKLRPIGNRPGVRSTPEQRISIGIHRWPHHVPTDEMSPRACEAPLAEGIFVAGAVPSWWTRTPFLDRVADSCCWAPRSRLVRVADHSLTDAANTERGNPNRERWEDRLMGKYY
jgi:hypothetical protein